MPSSSPSHLHKRPVLVQLPQRQLLDGALCLPATPRGLVLLLAGDPGLPYPPLPAELPDAVLADGFATLRVELLSHAEQRAERETQHLRFDIALLAERLRQLLTRLEQLLELAGLPRALIASGAAAAAALRCAAGQPTALRATVLWGARPDMVGRDLAAVTAPSLLLVGADSPTLRELNRSALACLSDPAEFALISCEPGAAIPHICAWLQRTVAASAQITIRDVL